MSVSPSQFSLAKPFIVNPSEAIVWVVQPPLCYQHSGGFAMACTWGSPPSSFSSHHAKYTASKILFALSGSRVGPGALPYTICLPSGNQLGNTLTDIQPGFVFTSRILFEGAARSITPISLSVPTVNPPAPRG